MRTILLVADFASVSRGNTQLFLCQRCQGNAVDKLYADLRKRGAKIKAEPKNQPWGLREMQVADVDGNVMRIGSPIDHD